MKIEKILKDDTLSEKEKQALIDNLQDDGLQKRVKRSQLTDFRDRDAFIGTERDYEATDCKANKSSLWGENERDFLEDVTLNLVPDDEAAMSLRAKSHMKWDAKKKRYMLKKVDRDGKVIKEKRNEAGAKITNKNAEKTKESIYKKWMKKTHMKLQNAGELEDKRAIESAKSANESRKMMKHFKNRHGSELNRGEDPRSNKKMIEMKKKKMLEKIRENSKKNSKGKKGDKKINEKSWKKIVDHSRPTRSKAIMKSNKHGGRGGHGKQH
jgi:hypothetical protein